METPKPNEPVVELKVEMNTDDFVDSILYAANAIKNFNGVFTEELTPKPSLMRGIRPSSMIMDEMALIKSLREPAPPMAKPKPRAERSIPVRNPAFREHEGLKELQRQLNSGNRRK